MSRASSYEEGCDRGAFTTVANLRRSLGLRLGLSGIGRPRSPRPASPQEFAAGRFGCRRSRFRNRYLGVQDQPWGLLSPIEANPLELSRSLVYRPAWVNARVALGVLPTGFEQAAEARLYMRPWWALGVLLWMRLNMVHRSPELFHDAFRLRQVALSLRS